MSPEQPGHPDRKLADQLRFSAGKRIDGLWIGTIEPEPGPLLHRVEESLGLIKDYDRRRYDRLVRDLALVWVRRRLGSNARFNSSLHACELDAGFVLAGPSKAIAAAIVHVATRARLRRLGLDPQDQRARVTEICVGRELAFAARLPATSEAPERTEPKRDPPRRRAALRLAIRLASRLIDRIERHLATSRRVDGLWIGVRASEAEPLLRRVEEALALIKRYDRRRYDRLRRDVERVWVRDDLGPDSVGQFDPALWACELDDWLVLTATAEELAATIVHEATHARLWRRGIGYDESLRARVEAACFRRELAFAARLPNGNTLREDAKRLLRTPPAYWSDAALLERRIEQFTHYVRRLRELQAPDWLVRAMRTIRMRLRQKITKPEIGGR
jgi:hypothetical protein